LTFTNPADPADLGEGCARLTSDRFASVLDASEHDVSEYLLLVASRP
jgi:hypothetical protein